jgi:hypothetical protein
VANSYCCTLSLLLLLLRLGLLGAVLRVQFFGGGASGTLSVSCWLVAVGAAAGAACRSAAAAPFCVPPTRDAALAAASRDLRARNFCPLDDCGLLAAAGAAAAASGSAFFLRAPRSLPVTCRTAGTGTGQHMCRSHTISFCGQV